MNFKKFINWKFLLVLVTLGHFIYFLLEKRDIARLDDWEKNSCYFKNHRKLYDGDCRYYHVKRFVFSQPYLDYGETLNCETATPDIVKKFDLEVLNSNCPGQDIWGTPKVLWDLGWDAYSIWYGRAVSLYFQSQKPDWPGVLKAINDSKFVNSFANVEHRHYPWLLSVVYYSFMKLLASPNPMPLMILQCLIWVLCAYLLFLIWPATPFYAWIVFAFVPTSAVFMFRLYADIWVVFFGLLMLLLLQAQKIYLSAIIFFFGTFIKQEAFLHLGALWVTYFMTLNLPIKFYLNKKFLFIFLIVLSSVFLQQFNVSRFESVEFYVPLSKRISEGIFYTSLFPSILGYYADVFFRPAMWGLGPIWLIYEFAKSLKSVGHYVYIPLLVVIAAIPIAYSKYPFGYKEVVLTGAGRALWQSLPLLWLLLKNVHEKRVKA